MKVAWFHLVISVVLAHALAWAQQASNGLPATLAYENGSITNNVYMNECFGISLAIPDGWQISNMVVGTDGKAKHTTQGDLVLVLIDQQKEGAFGSTIILNAYDVSIYDKTVREFVSRYARGDVSSDQEHREIVKDAYSVDYAGKIFYRADIKRTLSNGHALYLSLVYTKFRGYYIGEILSAGSTAELELAATLLHRISFQEDKPNSKCMMHWDDNPISLGIIDGVINSKPIVSLSSSGVVQRVRVSQGVATGLLFQKVSPHYPANAQQGHIQGQVVLNAVIDRNGDVESLALVSGHPMLAPAAIEAVKQWKYKPYLLNGNPVAVETQIIVSFSLNEAGVAP
jgi:TonB family protein